MERMNEVIDIARSSRHMPFLLSLLVGIFVIRKDRYADEVEDPVIGDNVPASLMQSLGR